MKISVKQGRLMAVMAAMILIIGIFVGGKMLGYGSANNRYLLEGYRTEDVVEASGGGGCDGDLEDCFTDGKKKEGMKNKKETYETQKPLQPKELSGEAEGEEDEEVEEGEEVVTTEGKEEFTCGAKSGIPAYDDQEGVYAAF